MIKCTVLVQLLKSLNKLQVKFKVQPSTIEVSLYLEI